MYTTAIEISHAPLQLRKNHNVYYAFFFALFYDNFLSVLSTVSTFWFFTSYKKDHRRFFLNYFEKSWSETKLHVIVLEFQTNKWHSTYAGVIIKNLAQDLSYNNAIPFHPIQPIIRHASKTYLTTILHNLCYSTLSIYCINIQFRKEINTTIVYKLEWTE